MKNKIKKLLDSIKRICDNTSSSTKEDEMTPQSILSSGTEIVDCFDTLDEARKFFRRKTAEDFFVRYPEPCEDFYIVRWLDGVSRQEVYEADRLQYT